MSKKIIIWDLDKICNLQLDNIHLWNSYNSNFSQVSIPSILEKNSDKYKNLFLNLIYEISQKKINDKTLIDCLKIKDDFSLWWMNKVFEKNPLKLPAINDCLKMLVLEDLLMKQKYSEIIIYTSSKKLEKTISLLCNKVGINFESKLEKNKKKKYDVLKIFYILPHFFQGLIYYYYYIIKKFSLINKNFISTKLMTNSVYICSYFINFNYSETKNGIFNSSFWNCLPQELNKMNYKVNWMHHLILNNQFKEPKRASYLLSKINKNTKKLEIHNFLESYLDLQIIVKVFFLWLKCIYLSYKTKTVKHFFKSKNSNINFWILLKDEWKSSLYGKDSIHNLFMLELFLKYFKVLPIQKIGIYLYENQPWEMAMLYSWKKFQKAPIIGFAHATVPYWHLYYYNHKNFYYNLQTKIPQPDYVALNGKFAISNFKMSGFPQNKIVSVEALRYLNNNYENETYQIKKNKRILIVGEMHKESMEFMYTILEDAKSFFKKNNYDIGIKYHPSNILNFKDKKNIICKQETLPLEEIFYKYDIIICGNSTSAALEAYLLKKKVIIILSGSILNLSPLRSSPNVNFISSSKDLEEVLINYTEFNKTNISLENYLYLDKKIPKWLALLNSKSLT